MSIQDAELTRRPGYWHGVAHLEREGRRVRVRLVFHDNGRIQVYAVSDAGQPLGPWLVTVNGEPVPVVGFHVEYARLGDCC